MAEYHFPRDTAHIVVVVPREFGSRANIIHREERHPRETQVVRVDKHVLHENIGVATVVQEAPDVPGVLRVHYVAHLVLAEEFPDGFEFQRGHVVVHVCVGTGREARGLPHIWKILKLGIGISVSAVRTFIIVAYCHGILVARCGRGSGDYCGRGADCTRLLFFV